MVVALAGPVAIDFAGVMERANSFGDPQQHRQQHGGPPGSPAMPVYYYPQQPYYGYSPQSPHQNQQPASVQPYPNGMPAYQAHGYPYQVWYGPPQAVGPAPRAAHSMGDLPQAHPGYSPPRPLMRPPGMMPPGMVPPAMQSPVPAPRFQQERAPTPRGKFLIPGNGVRSSSTSSVKRGSTGSTVRSLSDDVTEQRAAAAAAAVDDVVPDTLEAPAAPLTQQQKDDSNAHAPCAFFLRTGTCAYGSRCKFQHASPTTSMAMLNSLGLPLRPGQPECQFYTKHMRCGFGASCKYHHPEPQGHQWQMVSQPPFMYPHPGVMPYLPAMPPPALMRSSSGYSERSPTVSTLSTRSLSSVPSFEDQALPQGGSTRRRSRLSHGGRGSRGGDASLPLPQLMVQPATSPPALPAAPVLLLSDDDMIVHHMVEQPALFGDMPAAGNEMSQAAGAAETTDSATDSSAHQLLAVAALLPPEESVPAAGPMSVQSVVICDAPPLAAAASQEESPKTTQHLPAVSEGQKAVGGGAPASAAGLPASASAASQGLAISEALLLGAADVEGPPSAAVSDTTSRVAGAAMGLSPPAAAAGAPAAQDAEADATADAMAAEIDRLEVESSDGSYCSAASESGSHQG